MPIKKQLSDLPFPSKAVGLPPVPKPIIVPVIAAKWFEKYAAEDDAIGRPMANSADTYRASWANVRCDRELFYKITGVEPAEYTLADYWRFGLGQMVHSYIDTEFPKAYPGADFEVVVDLRAIGLQGSAHADLVLPGGEDHPPVVVEVKTINGFGFKRAATRMKGPEQGPRFGAIVQGALAAAALKANLIIAYFSLENLSPSMMLAYGDGTTLGQFAAEWHFDADTAAAIAEAEVARIHNLLDLIDAKVLPPRTIHDPEVEPGNTVTDPKRKMWTVQDGDRITATGSTWMCDYCNFRDRCIDDGPGGTQVAVTL